MGYEYKIKTSHRVYGLIKIISYHTVEIGARAYLKQTEKKMVSIEVIFVGGILLSDVHSLDAKCSAIDLSI